MKFKLIYILILLTFSLVSNPLFALQVKDMLNRTIEIKKTPTRIICLSPGSLRIISYMKATNLVVGIEEFEVKNENPSRPYWIANIHLKNLPIIAPGGPSGFNKIPDLEKIIPVKPDVIFVTMLEKDTADEFQRKIGVPVVVLDYGSFASFDIQTIVSAP